MASATADGKVFSSTVSYDVFGRESSRSITQNGQLFQTISLSYHTNGKIATRQISDANQVTITRESYTYDTYGRLINYACAGPQYGVDQRGRQIQSQQFTYDHLNNITEVLTDFVDHGSDKASRFFTGADPTQLTQIANTNPVQVIQLRYDACGNLASDGVS
eukprot:gene26523-34233_t